ncbi:MAG: plasmid recombination protein [Deltaproteobacteria bacterium]|jgi:hypothetical protein|nr:plasmid recombination protein [Deltaproteobacteria bacterium]
MSQNFWLKLAKLRTWSDIDQAHQHNSRAARVINADPNRSGLNRLLLGQADLDARLWGRARLGESQIPKNRLLGASLLLEASPSYFRPGRAERPGEFDWDRVNPWAQASQRWLAETFGANVMSSFLHLDEVTPHIHTLIMPLTPDNRLNYSYFFSNFEMFRKYWETYYDKIKHLGFEKGRPDSLIRASPKSLSYYPYVNIAQKVTPLLIPKSLAQPELPGPLGRRWPGLAETTAKKTGLALLSRIREELVQRVRQYKRQILALRVQFNQAYRFLDSQFDYKKVLLDSFSLIRDRYVGCRLRRTPGVEFTSVAAARKSPETIRPSELPPRDERPLSLGTRPGSKTRLQPCFWGSEYFEGDYSLGQGLKFQVKENIWRDVANGIEGQGSVAFFTYLLGYPASKWCQATKFIANDEKIIKLMGSQPQVVLARALSYYKTLFMAQRMAQVMAHSLKTLDKPELRLSEAQEQLAEAWREVATEKPPFGRSQEMALFPEERAELTQRRELELSLVRWRGDDEEVWGDKVPPEISSPQDPSGQKNQTQKNEPELGPQPGPRPEY